MDASPFPHHGPLPPERVSGRDDESHDLAVRLRDHHPVAILGPRRYGKTSLVRHALWRVDQVTPTTVVWVDLYGLTSFGDFAVRLDQALVDVRGRVREVVDGIAGGLSVRLGVVGVELRRAAPSGPDPVAACHDLLEVLVRSAAREPIVLVLDEFSDVTAVDRLDGLLRTHLQHRYGDIGLVFAGSRPSMMRTLFGDRERPFFSQADLIEIGPLRDETVLSVVHEGFRQTGRRAGPIASRVVALAVGHPQRSMMLAHTAWSLTPEGSEATDTTWDEAVAAARLALDGPLAALYQALPAAQGPVLRSIARTGSAYASSEARFHDLSKSAITTARDALLRDAHVARDTAGKLSIVDPLLADWLLRTFP